MKKTPQKGRPPKKILETPVDLTIIEEKPPIPEENIVGLEPQFQRLLTSKGFIDAFWEMLSYYCNHEEAYEAVERQYEAQFGKRKYASFESFRICRDKFLNKEK
jgi:hypothetical protein